MGSLNARPDACALLVGVTVKHEDTQTLREDSHYVAQGKVMEEVLLKHEPDYLPSSSLNKWWDTTSCEALLKERQPIASYRSYLQAANIRFMSLLNEKMELYNRSNGR